MSLSRIAPKTAWVRGKNPIWSRFCASAATACGLWATSRTSAGWPAITWNRPGSSTVARPVRIAWALIGSRSRSASKAASAPEALSNWFAPRRAG